MQEGKPEDPEKTCGSKYGLETKCTYGAGTEVVKNIARCHHHHHHHLAVEQVTTNFLQAHRSAANEAIAFWFRSFSASPRSFCM